MKGYTVVGLRVEKYIGTKVSGHNCDFTYEPEIQIRPVLLLKHYSEKYELTLQTDEYVVIIYSILVKTVTTRQVDMMLICLYLKKFQ